MSTYARRRKVLEHEPSGPQAPEQGMTQSASLLCVLVGGPTACINWEVVAQVMQRSFSAAGTKGGVHSC